MFSFKNLSSEKRSLWYRSWQPFFSLPIHGKFIVVLASFLAGYILIGITSFHYTHHMKEGLHNLEKNYTITYHYNNHLKNSLQELQSRITVIINSSAPLDIKSQQGVTENIMNIRSILNQMEADDISPKNSLEIEEIKKDFKVLSENLEDNLLSESALGKSDFLAVTKRKKITDDLTGLLHLVSDNIQDLIRIHQSGVRSLIDRTNRQFHNNAILLVGLIIFLSTTSLLCINLLVKLLGEMKDQLDAIRTSKDDISADDGHDLIPVISRDEIGALAKSANDLIIDIKSLRQFRRTIEADESVEDVYKRLAEIFKHRLKLDFFALWEVREHDEGTIQPAYIWPPEMEDFLCPLTGPDMCRAKRLDDTVSSVGFPGICPLFPEPDAMTHTCIPLTVSGTNLGVAQFLFKYVDREERSQYLRESLYSAGRYLREALPILHAKRLAQNLHMMATRDSLTGLYNRRFLEGNLSTLTAGVKRRDSQLGILMCDMDYFKQVNDEYGHEAGDTILVGLASILQNSVREADMVIRYGGEEFLVLLFECSGADALMVADKIRKTVEEKQFRIGGNSIRKTISIGVSSFPVDTDGFWEAIKFADVALYQAKGQGRNRALRFNREMWEGGAY